MWGDRLKMVTGSNTRLWLLPVSLNNYYERIAEANFLDEFDGVAGPREHPNNCPTGTESYDHMQYSNRPDL